MTSEFCYVCGGAWRTCDCTMEQLAAVKRDAEERRFARARRDATEEAELAEALRQVAEFEREEALKAELLRREQQRRARAAHVRREAARRGEVADRFRALRQELAAARVRQRAAVQQDHDAAGQDLERRDEAAREAAERQRAEEQEALREAADAQLAELEARMRAEYAARVAEERRIGAQYAAQLEAYWERRRLRLRQQREKKKQSQLLPGRQKGKGRGGPAGIVDIDIDGNGNGNGNHHEARSDNGNDDDSGDDSETAKAQIHAALAELQRRLDAGFAAWQRRARDALEGCKWAAREEAAIRAELAEEADRRRTGARRAGLAALARRVAAERRWVDAAVAEGARALDAMEQAEVAGRDALSQDDVDAWFLQGGGIAGLDGDADGDGGVGLGFGVGVDMGALGYLGDEEEEDGEEQEEEEVEGDGDGASISRGSGGLTTAMAAETAKSTATATDTVTAATVMSEVAAWEDTWEQVDCHRRHHEDMREFVVPGAFVA
ncbi:hypothetical protein SLS62_002824 [Diatrype stigma]|uniref:Uncharacterized protein n=1 Tax=Diatrype stigma TaxID=117547 RepID=A0AAN9UY39_9PEZI